MSTKGTRTKRTGFGRRPNHKRDVYGGHKNDNSFLAACQEAVNREAPPLPPYELPEDSKEKSVSFPETDTENFCEESDAFEYKVLFERSEVSAPEWIYPETVSTKEHNVFDRSMFLVLLVSVLISLISICGWIGTYVVFRKALWSSTQEKLELQERLRQYEPEEQHP